MAKLADNVVKFLTEGRNFATVSTLMDDGSPQGTLVWIDSDGEHVIFNTSEGRLKTKNLQRDPRVAVTVFNPENPFEQTTIRGNVVDMTHDGAVDHINKLAKKYMGLDEYPRLMPGEQRVIVKIRPDRVSSMG